MLFVFICALLIYIVAWCECRVAVVAGMGYGVVVREGKTLPEGFPVMAGGKRLSLEEFEDKYPGDVVASHCFVAESFVMDSGAGWMKLHPSIYAAGVNHR